MIVLFLLPIWISVIFSCLITIARISNVKLIKSDGNVHPYLVPDLRETLLVFSC